ncbi:MAG TPA: chemotaxis protein CheB, partial [Verrucomicrobiae bacterium]|nr:chemotaxis protein CheB [Verrucomicrobiae bacterium]
MKQKNLTRLSQQYETALAKLLKQGPAASVQPAAKLGHTAFTLGLDTLDLARIHDQAMAALGLAGVENAFAKLARLFFAEANAPIVATQRAAQADKASLSRTQAALDRRTQELVASTLELQRGAARNKLLEQAVEKNGHQHRESLEESLQLQKRLRQLTHRVMKMQEEERKFLSHELQNEIAQTLLGINARLLALRHENRTGARSLEDEIATTRQLVASSARSVRQFARSLDTPSFSHDRKSYVAAPFPSVNRSFPVIAMAASAGGLKALSIILAGLPPDLPAAIAIVMHVAPDHKSLLADILKCRTDLSVKQASTGDMLAPSHVFIAPPNHHLF